MRKLCFCLVSVFLLFSFYFPSASLAVETLAVWDLTAKHGVKESLAEGLSVVIRDTIHGLGDYEVLSREDVQVIAERTTIRQKVGCDDTECLINIGKSLGTKFMVAGAISKFGNTYNVSLRLIETIGKNPGVRKRVSKNCKCAEDELISTSATVAAKLMEESVTQTESSTIKPYAKLSLRKEPKKMLGEDAVRTMLKKHDFSDSERNPNGSFDNDFVDNGDSTITDRATGLMWDKGGSPTFKSMKRAKFYVRKLNERRFAGYSDWRLPTVEELASLLRKDENNGIHTDPLFDTKQETCWSSDKGPPFGGFTANPPQVWHVNFREGSLGLTILPIKLSIHTTTHRYVRAVRSLR